MNFNQQTKDKNSVLKEYSRLAAIIGTGLAINGLHLIWASRQATLSKNLLLYFSCSDFLWVLGTAMLILKGIWITSLQGIIVAIAVSIGVGTFGILQLLKRKMAVN